MPVNIKADQIVNSNLEAFSFFFTDLQEGQGLVFNVENNRWENAFVASAEGEASTDTTPVVDTGSQTWAQQQAEQLGEATVASELFDATFYGMNSLYFDGNSYLVPAWTPTQDLSKYTVSYWYKRTLNESNEYMYHIGGNQYGFAFSRNSTYYAGDSNHYFYSTGGNAENNSTGHTYVNDTSWHHFVGNYDGTTVKGYVDNKLCYSIPTTTTFTITDKFQIGAYYNESMVFIFEGRMSNIQFIDGMALDANYFGEYMGANWVPKVYEGAYGANGFWLDFSKTQWDSVDGDGNPTADANLQTVEDVSGNGNHWSAA